MQRKKILWLVSWYPNKNGRFDGDFIQRHARAAAIHHDIHVIFVTDANIENPVVEEWSYATGLTEQIVYFSRKKGIGTRIRKQLAWKNSFQSAVKKYIEKKGLPDCVHVHVPWKAAIIALWMKRKYGKEFIVTEHWGGYNHLVENNFYTKPRLVQTLLKKLFLESKTFVSVSYFLSNTVEAVTGKKADVIIPNVVDTTLFLYRKEKYSKFTFIHVSNMVALKNVAGILEAFKKLVSDAGDTVQLILIGDRDNECHMHAERLELLNSSVFFMGEISYSEVAREMGRSHCFILNSIMENSPCVIGEALCCGLPVIATNVGGVSELVADSNSRLIEANNDDALVKAMKDVLCGYSVFDQVQISKDAARNFGYLTIGERFDELYKHSCQEL